MNCIDCNIKLIIGKNWYKSAKDNSQRICKVCSSRRSNASHRKSHKLKPFKYKAKDLNNKYPGKITERELKNVWEMQQSYCAICKIKLENIRKAHADHIIPRKLGGINSKDNIQFLCKKCNMGKWDWTQETYIEHCKKVVENN